MLQMLYHVHLGTVKEVIKHNKIVYSKKTICAFFSKRKFELLTLYNTLPYRTSLYVIDPYQW